MLPLALANWMTYPGKAQLLQNRKTRSKKRKCSSNTPATSMRAMVARSFQQHGLGMRLVKVPAVRPDTHTSQYTLKVPSLPSQQAREREPDALQFWAFFLKA